MRLKGAKIMISDDTKRRRAYERLRKLTSDRVVRALGLSEEDSFNVSFATALELFGVGLIWDEPKAKKPVVTQRVQ
jgi:hypothetical protein